MTSHLLSRTAMFCETFRQRVDVESFARRADSLDHVFPPHMVVTLLPSHARGVGDVHPCTAPVPCVLLLNTAPPFSLTQALLIFPSPSIFVPFQVEEVSPSSFLVGRFADMSILHPVFDLWICLFFFFFFRVIKLYMVLFLATHFS